MPNVETGKPLHTIAGPVARLAFSRDGAVIAGGLGTESGSHVKLWDVASGAERFTNALATAIVFAGAFGLFVYFRYGTVMLMDWGFAVVKPAP